MRKEYTTNIHKHRPVPLGYKYCIFSQYSDCIIQFNESFDTYSCINKNYASMRFIKVFKLSSSNYVFYICLQFKLENLKFSKFLM